MTHHNRKDSSARGISPSQRPLPNNTSVATTTEYSGVDSRQGVISQLQTNTPSRYHFSMPRNITHSPRRERRKQLKVWGVHWIRMAMRQGPEAGSCEHENEHSSSIQDWEVLDQLREHRFLNQDSAPSSSKNL
jgi:hypothetical protein